MKEPNKRKILIWTIIVSMVPMLLIVKFPSVVTLKSISLYASALCGYAGIVILLWSYILGAKSVMGIFFRDLAPVLGIHKWLGKWGTLAIFLHPLLVMYSYGENLLYTVLPITTTRFESHVTLGRLSFIILLVVWVSSALLRGKMKFRPWRYIHLLGYIVLPFAFLHVPDVGSQFMSITAVKVYFFALAIVYAVFLLLRLRGLLNLDKSAYTIVQHRQLVSDDPEVWLVQLRPISDRLTPKLGQYVYLKDGFISEEHPFSVIDFDEATGTISIAYRTFGRFTKEFAKRAVGAKVYLGGPHGEFTSQIADEPDPVVFVAGGIGVTPMVQHIAQGQNREQWLFYANRTKQSAIIVSALRRLLGDRLIALYSRQTEGLEPTDEMGHITADTFRRHLADPLRYKYYLCGSDAMMNTVSEEIRSLGVPVASIRREAFDW